MITTILAILGIIGFFIGNKILLYIGMFSVIIEYIYGFATGKLKSLMTLLLAILIGIFISLLGINIFQSIAVCICFESVIMFVGGIMLTQKIYKKIDFKDKNNNEYFYTDNCYEMNELINKWSKLPGFNSRIRRIIVLDDYDTLKTTSARIVFLFNLLLDMSDSYIEFRKYMDTTSIIDKEYINKANNFLEYNNNCLEKTYYIYFDLRDNPIFNIYSKNIYGLIGNFKEIYNILKIINIKFAYTLNFGKEKIDDFSIIDEECDKLTKITNIYSNNLVNLQKIINNNDDNFNTLKMNESEKCKIAMK